MLKRQENSLHQMLKRQESSLSSSRWETPVTPPPPETHHAKAIGCMSGIIHLISKYQNRNKLLTFGRKQQEEVPLPTPRNAKASVPTKASPSTVKENIKKLHTETQILDSKGLSSNTIPRSPTLPPEIRLSNAGNSSEIRKTPSLVARLMGLEEILVKRPALHEDPIAENRKKILQALDKCNEDLEALKKIIRRVQSSDKRLLPSQEAAKGIGGGGNEHSMDVKTEELSPVCVLDEFTRSPLSSFSKEQNNGILHTPHQRKPSSAKKPGEDDHTIVYRSLFQIRRETTVSPGWITRAKFRSVDEVCSDIAWGEKREVGRIGLVLEDYICRDLIEEFVKELMKCCCMYSLPFEACKKRLLF
ncbi:uncharacterized protein LOC111387207 [Olea europaea var. sylvestris]|uniref:uncharacterized protein LOC111387207 n=1 Tax=Olea europaea var. sylvestris TaxID=158386 RepID=UPI000C1CFE0B|nr:uncharacterized protein LOC111387207 [Olea europaea var. sylvestris]